MRPAILLFPLIAVLASCASSPEMPPLESLDRSGIVSSSVPNDRQALFKGFLPQQGQRKVAILVRHSNPSAGRRIYCVTPDGERAYRTIRKVVNLNYLANRLRYPEIVLFGDVSLALVDAPFPDSCATYPIGKAHPERDQLVNVNQFGEIRSFAAGSSEEVPFPWWLSGDGQERDRFLLGDSGTPWFIGRKGQWQVVSLTSKGRQGEGPHLGHPVFRWRIEQAIHALIAE